MTVSDADAPIDVPSLSEIADIEQDYQALLKIEKAMARLRSQAVLLLRYNPPFGHGLERATAAAKVIGRHFTTVQGIERRAREWGLEGQVIDTEEFRAQAQALHDIVQLGLPYLAEGQTHGD
jgi:hypothetical protein